MATEGVEWMPVMATRPALRASWMAWLVVCSAAAQSMAQSTPRLAGGAADFFKSFGGVERGGGANG